MTSQTDDALVEAIASAMWEYDNALFADHNIAEMQSIARAAIEAVRAHDEARGMQWQPIEAAPKDGTEIDLWLSGYKGRIRREPNCKWLTEYGDSEWMHYTRDAAESHSDSWQPVGDEIIGWSPIQVAPTQKEAEEILSAIPTQDAET